MNIKLMKSVHWTDVKRIYREGIKTGQATFEKEPPGSWGEWSQKHLTECSLVCLEGDQFLGWAAISPVSQRCIYQGVGEVSVYVSEGNQGMGVGEELLKELINISEREGIWTLQAGIFPENESSLQLHKKLGFREVGLRTKIGKMSYGPLAGKWRDVVLIEKRSQSVGME